MAKKIDNMDLWLGFRQSTEYTAVDEYPEMLIQATLTYFEDMAEEISVHHFTEWDATEVETFLTEMVEQAREEPDEESEAILTMTYAVIRAFLRYLANQGKLRLSVRQLSALLTRHERDAQLLDPDAVMIENADDGLPTGANIQTAGLPQWQARTAHDIDRYTQEWVAAYATDQTAWQQRPKGVERDFLETIVSVLTEQAYNQFRKTPKTWTKRVIGEVFAGEFVTNLVLSDQEYALVAPALSQWIDYVAQCGWLNAKRAASYQRYFMATAPKMVELAANPDNFNPAKMMAHQMQQRGIDPEDDQAVQAFVQEVNNNGGLDTLYQSGLAPDNRDGLSEFTPDEIQTMLVSDEVMDRLADLYDPDEDGDYLKFARVAGTGKLRWTKASAKRVHHKGVVLGLRLWLQRRKYQLIAGWDALTVIDNVSGFTDVIYAQNLQAPTDWTPAAWQDFGQWLRSGDQPAEMVSRVVTLLTKLTAMLVDEQTITSAQGNQLRRAICDEPASQQDNVISFKQARQRKERHWR